MATKGTAWVLRRCTDLVPYLLAMAARECLRGPRPEVAGHGPPAPAPSCPPSHSA